MEHVAMNIRSMIRRNLLLLACLSVIVALPGGSATSEVQDNWVTVVDVDDFGMDDAGWFDTNWRRMGHPYQTENEARVDKDGALRLYLRPYTGDGSYYGHHGNVSKRPLPLYGDFEAVCGLQWDWKSRYTVRSGMLSLVGPNGGITVLVRGASINVWPGMTETAKNVSLSLKGDAIVRFVRRDGMMKVFWNDVLIAEAERRIPFDELCVTAKTFEDNQRPGSFFGLTSLVVRADPGDLPVAGEPVAEPESLFVGGDFQKAAEGEIGVDLSGVGESDDLVDVGSLMEVEPDGPTAIGAGELEGWATPVGGKQFVWFHRDKERDDKALLLDVSGKPGGVIFRSRPFLLKPGTNYVLEALTKLSRNVFAEIRIDPVQGSLKDEPVAEWRDTTANRQGKAKFLVRRVVNNWSPVSVRFGVEKEGEYVLSLNVTPLSSGDPFGNAAFDEIVVRELNARDGLGNELQSFFARAVDVRKQAEQAGYKSETVLDIAGFDLAEAPDSEEKTRALGECDAYRKWLKETGEIAARNVSEAVRDNGAVATFFDRLPTEEIEKRITRLRDTLAVWDVTEKEWLKRAEDLRSLTAKLRLPRVQTPDYTNNVEWAANNFHIYWFNHYGLNPPGIEEAIRYMGAMGATELQIRGFVPGRRGCETWEDYEEYARMHLDLCEREGMKVFIIGGAGPITRSSEAARASVRKCLKRYIDAFKDHPAFGGFEMDEISSHEWPDFPSYLKSRFTKDELIDLKIISSSLGELDRLDTPEVEDEQELPEAGVEGIGPVDTDTAEIADAALDEMLEDTPEEESAMVEGPLTSIPSNEFRNKNLTLFMIGLEWRAEAFEQSLAAGFEYGHSLKKDVLFMPLLSAVTFLGGPFNASLAGVSAVGDMVAIDPYWNGIPEEAMYCDLMSSCSKGPALLTVGTHYGGNPDSLARDLAISFAHTDGVYIFDWPFCFKHKGPYIGYWYPPGKWEKVWAFAQRASKIEPYLVHTRTCSEAAMIYSERSSAVDYYQRTENGMGSHLQAGRYAASQFGLYCLFLQGHLSMDTIYMRSQVQGSLDRYKVLVIQDGASMTEQEEELIREWVRDGGYLIATASTSLRDRWGRWRENYGLADVFGVRYVETEESGETWFGEDPEVKYTKRRFFDVVEPTTGKTTSTWKDGRPAVIENSFGKGRCVFVTARDLGNCCDRKPRGHDGPRWYLKTHKDYWPGVREFMTAQVLEGLRAKDSRPLFITRNCPKYVETVMRAQGREGDPSRRVIHLLNYSFEEPISGVKLEVPVKADGNVKAFYADDGTKVDAEMKQDGKGKAMVMRLRDFNVHECVVLENIK